MSGLDSKRWRHDWMRLWQWISESEKLCGDWYIRGYSAGKKAEPASLLTRRAEPVLTRACPTCGEDVEIDPEVAEMLTWAAGGDKIYRTALWAAHSAGQHGHERPHA